VKKFLIISSFLIVFIILSGCGIGKDNFEQYFNERTEIVKMIESSDLTFSENGIITLPDKYVHVSDGGEALVGSYNGKVFVYFWTSRGILESSKGYLYFSDIIFPEDFPPIGHDFVNMRDLGDGWYSCSTD